MQQYEVGTNSFEEEMIVEGQYMTKLKYLKGFVSLASDKQGIAKFPDLAFSDHGLPGTYELQFYADSGAFVQMPFAIAAAPVFAYADYAPTDAIAALSFDPVCIAAREEMAQARGQSNIPAGSECVVVQLGQPWPPREDAFKVTTLSSDGSIISGSFVNVEAVELPAKITFVDPISLIPSLVPPPRVPAFVPSDFRFTGTQKPVFNAFTPPKDGIATTSGLTYSSAPSTSKSPSLLFDIVVARVKPQPVPLAGKGSDAVYGIVHVNIMGGGTHGIVASRPLVLAVRIDRFVSAELHCAPATGMVPNDLYNPALPLQSQINQISPQYCGDIEIERPINDAQYVVAEKALTNEQTIIARVYPAWMGNISYLPKRRLCIGWMPLNRDHRAPYTAGIDATYDWYESSNPWTNPSARIPPFCGLSNALGRVQFNSIRFLFPASLEYFVFEALDIESYPSIFSSLPSVEQNTQKAINLQSYERCMSSTLGALVRNSTGCKSRHYIANIGMPFTMIGAPTAGLHISSTGVIPFPLGSETTSSLVNADNNPSIMDGPWNAKALGSDVLSAAHVARSPKQVALDQSLHTLGRLADVSSSSITYDPSQSTNKMALGKANRAKLQQSAVGLIQGISFAFAGVRSTTLFAIRTMSLEVQGTCEQFLSSSDFSNAGNYISIISSNATAACSLPQISKAELLYTNDTTAAGGGPTGMWNPSATANVVVGQSFFPQLNIQVLGCTGQPLLRQDFRVHARLQRLDSKNKWQEDPASEYLRDAVSQPQGGAAGVHTFPASFGLDYARQGTYRLVFYVMEAAMLRRHLGKKIGDQYDVPPLYSASFVITGAATFQINLKGGSVISNAAVRSVPDQLIGVQASLITSSIWQQGNVPNAIQSEIWLPPSLRIIVVPVTHAMIHGAIPSKSSTIGEVSAAQLSHAAVGSNVASMVSALRNQWPGSDNFVDNARHRVPQVASPAFSFFLSQIDDNAAIWSSAAFSQFSELILQPICRLVGTSFSCESSFVPFPVNAYFQSNIPLMALAFIQGNPIPAAAAPVFLADVPQSVALVSAPSRLHQFVRFKVMCRVANRAGSPVSSAPVELLLQPLSDLKTKASKFLIDGDTFKQSDSQGMVAFIATIVQGPLGLITASCKSMGIVSEQSSPILLSMEATLSVMQMVGPILSKVTKISVPAGHLRCCSAPSADGESVVPIVNTADKSADRALLEQAILILENSGGRKFSFVVSDRVSENIQMLIVDHTGQVMQGLIVIESAETNLRGRCTLSGFQFNPRIESGFYRIAMCYNSQCLLEDKEIYIDNRVIDYSNISTVFFLIMLVLAFASPLFFLPNLVDNSRALFCIPVAVGFAVAFASQAYNLVSLQPLASKIYVNFRIVQAEEILLSTMLQIVCVVLIFSSLLQLFVGFFAPNAQFYFSKSSKLHSLFGRIGAAESIIKAHLALEENKASSIRTEGLFVVQVAPRSSLFMIPQVSAATLARHYWAMLSGHLKILYYRIYNKRPYRDSLYGRTSDFVFPQRVSSTILLLVVAIVAISFFFYFIVRKLRYTIVYSRMLFTEAMVSSDLYLWDVLPISFLPFYLDPERTPLYLMIIYDFITNTLGRGTAFYLELLSAFTLSTAASVIASSIVIAAVAAQSLAVYRQEMMLARRGKLDWGPFRGLSGGTQVENAARYLGTQTVAYVTGWLFILILLFAPIFAMTWIPVRRFLATNLQNFFILCVLIVLAGSAISKLSRHLTLDDQQNIRNRKAFSYLEVFSLPLHYAFGLFSCMWRIVMAIFTFLTKITPLSSPLFVYSDPAYASFRAGQYIDHLHNSPSTFSAATSLIEQLDRRYIRMNTPTTAEPSLIQLEIQNMEQAEGRRKLLAAWQHLCAFANNDSEFSLRARRYESKYDVGIRISSSANLIFGNQAKALKYGSTVDLATFVPPKFSSRASILAHNFAIRQERIKTRAAAAITGAVADAQSPSETKQHKLDDSLDEPKIFIPAASRVTEFQDKLQMELRPKAFAVLASKSGGSSELKDMVGGPGVLAFEKELKKLSVRKQLAEGLGDDEDHPEASESHGELSAVEELPAGLREKLGGNGRSQSELREVTRITQTYRMAQNELHRREVAERIEIGAENIQARMQQRNDLLLSRETLDSLAKEMRR